MIEYLIRVECKSGTFMVSAGFKKSFALKMFDTFTLRDADNQNIPHRKHLVEMHAEGKDLGIDGPVEITNQNDTFDDYLESHQREMRPAQLKEAERRIDEAIRKKRQGG